jgi:hypothetical protein
VSHTIKGRLPTALALGLLLAWTSSLTAAEDLPFRSRHSGAHQQDPNGRCKDPNDPLDDRSTMSLSGAGHALHLGRIKVEQSHCIDLTGPDPLAFTDGLFTLTAADGDTVTGTYGGRLQPTVTPNLFYIDGTFLITGGTGRFAGASGGGAATGMTDLLTSEIELAGHFSFAPPSLQLGAAHE